MNSQIIFKRMRWNFLTAIGMVITVALLAVGVVFAAAPTGTNDSPANTNPQSPLYFADFGDLPTDYGITSYPNGAYHEPNGLLKLGSLIDSEYGGWPDPSALGDDTHDLDDEDGVVRNMNELWTIGNTVHLTVTVEGCVDNCYLNGWIDWGGGAPDWSLDGDQVFTDTQVINGTNVLPVDVPTSGYVQGHSVFARFRLCSYSGDLPDGCNSLVGLSDNGEVEDYWWDFEPTAVELVSLEANTNYAVPFALLAGALVLLIIGGAILAFKRRQA